VKVYLSRAGYQMISVWEEVTSKRKPVYYHRWLYEQLVGSIPAGMDLHHINGDRQDNRLCNLALVAHGDHLRGHHGWRPTESGWQKQCPDCGEWKPVSEAFWNFNKSGPKRGQPTPYCRPCANKRARDYCREHDAQRKGRRVLDP